VRSSGSVPTPDGQAQFSATITGVETVLSSAGQEETRVPSMSPETWPQGGPGGLPVAPGDGRNKLNDRRSPATPMKIAEGAVPAIWPCSLVVSLQLPYSKT